MELKSFETWANEKVKANESIVCEKCEKTFESQEELDQHMESCSKVDEKSKVITEKIIKFTEFSTEGFAEELVTCLEASEKIFKEVKMKDDGRSVEVTDSNDAKYSIWIEANFN